MEIDNKEISQTTSSSKLKGCYLLIILSAPKTKADKEEIIQRVAKGNVLNEINNFKLLKLFKLVYLN